MVKLKHLAALMLSGSLLVGQAVYAQETLPTIYIAPTWSPDGQSIAYMNNDGISVMDQNGDNIRHISPPQGFEGWTPDSHALIIIKNGAPASGQDWWLYPVDGTEPLQLLPEFELIQYLAYAPDGKHLAIYGQQNPEDQPGLWLVEVNGANAVDPDAIYTPVLLADELLSAYHVQKIQWATDDELILTAALDSPAELVQVSLKADQPLASVDQLIIEPLAEDTLELAGGWQLAFDPTTTGTQASYYARSISHPSQEAIVLDSLIYSLSQSADEQSLVYVSYCKPDEVPSWFLHGEWSAAEQAAIPTSLHLINLAEGTETTLVECGTGSQVFPAFSPDSSSLVFVTDSEAGWGISRVDLLPEGAFNLTDITPVDG